MTATTNDEEALFYLQDCRSYVGNDVLWWAKAGGYTTDVSKARTFTKDRAQRQHNARASDIPWPKPYIDARTRPAVDMQYIKIGEALEGAGIELVAPIRVKVDRPRERCCGCGVFMSDAQRYTEKCPRCGADNRP